MIPSFPIEGFEGLPQSNESLPQSIEGLIQFKIATIIYFTLREMSRKTFEKL
jgi:hypothetical protein